MNNTSNQINKIELTVRVGDNPIIKKERQGMPFYMTHAIPLQLSSYFCSL